MRSQPSASWGAAVPHGTNRALQVTSIVGTGGRLVEWRLRRSADSPGRLGNGPAVVDLLAVHPHVVRCGDAQADLVARYGHDRDPDVPVDDDFLTDAAR